MYAKHSVTVVLAMLVSTALTHSASAQRGRPLQTVRARIYNDSGAEVRVKIIPYTAYQLPYVVDLNKGDRSPPIFNLLTGNRVVVLFDRPKREAVLARSIRVEPDKDLNLRVKQDKTGAFDLAVEVVVPKKTPEPKGVGAAPKKKATPKKKAAAKKKTE